MLVLQTDLSPTGEDDCNAAAHQGGVKGCVLIQWNHKGLVAKLGVKVCVLNVSWEKKTCFTKFDFFQCQVDGKVRADMFYPAGFMDMVWTPITLAVVVAGAETQFPSKSFATTFWL